MVKRTLKNDFLVAIFTAISIAYLLNPTAGFIEFIPDNIPIIGNLDDIGAFILLLKSLAYWGIDLRGVVSAFGNNSKNRDINN